MKSKLLNRLKVYFEDKPEVIAVYLFGSQVSDKNKRSSDVDLGILIDTYDRKIEAQKRRQYMVDLAGILKKEIHPVVLNSASEELMRQIFKKGYCILIRDPQKLSIFKMTMFSRIADFGYYRKQMQSGLIRNIVEGS
jgi:predicted nucleotidyltransferase